ncbi:ABC transporter permease [Streptomyces boluensis]|uniref:FtsX-like permease family protein n=1 Tax=Streptomyces boluensis TaxID=1775135 RepID=A0A964UQH6_9ACTN|nr:ABC transporter permease [Streptomyces boluensis]NBE52636.1 FtsX-like permease family protein [Streptomyces boluensis]
MFRTALRNVLAHKARLLMTVLAVLLGVAFVSGTLVFTNTVSDAFQKSSAQGFDHVDVAIKPEQGDAGAQGGRPGAAPALTQELLDRSAKVDGAASATGTVSGFAALAGKDGELLGDGWSTRGANYFPGPDGKDDRYPMRDGRAPSGKGEIALDAKTAERAGFEVGDTVRMSIDGPVLTPKVTGIFTTDDGNVAAGGSLALFDTKTAQGLYAKPGEFSEIDVRAAAGTSQAALMSEIEKVLPKNGTAAATTGKELADEQAEAISTSMSGMRTGLLVFAGISLFVGIFIIANTFTMLVAQRTKELALMRAVGASRRQVTRSVLIEAFLVGTVAAVTGLAAGIGIGAGLRSLMGSFGGSVPDGPLVVSPATVITSLLVGVVVTMLAAWLPGRRAAKIPPVAAMNSVHAAASTKSLVVRNTIGALLSGAGVAAVLAGTTMGDDGKLPMGLGAALLLVGVFVLTPLLSRPVIAAAAPLLKVFGISGKLARQNAVRNPRRTAATASALMIGLTLITGMTVIAGSVQKSIDKMATDSLRADYVVSMANFGPLSPDVEQKLKDLDGVTATSPLRNSPSLVDGEREYLTGVDAKTIGQLAELDFRQGSWDALGGAKAVVDSDTAKRFGWKDGSRFPVTYEDGKKGTLQVAGVYQGNEMMRGIMLDKDRLAPHQSRITDMQVMVKTSDGATPAAKESIREALGDNPAVAVDDKKDISDGIAQMFTLMLNMLYGLLAMAVIVAVLGVINTLAMSVFERSQEIGMLRAIGLDRKGIKRMVRMESLVISLFGGVLGIGLGVFFGWAAGELIGSSIATYELVLPWGRMGLFLALAALVGILAALWPARRAARLNMLSAIKAE